MFYRLVSLEQLPNTKNSYKGLSHYTARAREAHILTHDPEMIRFAKKKGTLPPDCFADEGRVVKGQVPKFMEVEQLIEAYANTLRDLPQTYFRDRVPIWKNQPVYIEIWIEKLALADTIVNFVGDRQVRVVVNRGYSGFGFFYDNIRRLAMEAKRDSQKQIKILYLGDFDPSGEDMDRHISETLADFGLTERVSFQRLAITKAQIEQFNLPHVPASEETMEKVRRDPRTKGFIKKHGELYVVELDALLAVQPAEFRALVQQAIDANFDNGRLADLKAEYSEAEIKERLIEGLQDLLADLKDGKAD